MIKVKYSALIELECEMDEYEPGVMLLNEIIKIDDGKWMDNGVRRCIEDHFGRDGWTVKVAQRDIELRKEE